MPFARVYGVDVGLTTVGGFGSAATASAAAKVVAHNKLQQTALMFKVMRKILPRRVPPINFYAQTG
jgi:hypothetical protein